MKRILICYIILFSGCASNLFVLGYIPMEAKQTKFKYISKETSLKSQVEAFNKYAGRL